MRSNLSGNAHGIICANRHCPPFPVRYCPFIIFIGLPLRLIDSSPSGLEKGRVPAEGGINLREKTKRNISSAVHPLTERRYLVDLTKIDVLPFLLVLITKHQRIDFLRSFPFCRHLSMTFWDFIRRKTHKSHFC